MAVLSPGPHPCTWPGTTNPRGPLRTGQYPFLCQSDGSKYSVGNRTNHWWAWVGSSRAGAWVPVVFLTGGPDDAPEPGLPKCGSAPATTTTATSSPPSGAVKTNNIVDHKTGRCLDSNDNGNAYTLECNGGDYQKWDVTIAG